MANKRRKTSLARAAVNRLITVAGAAALTLLFFLILPLMQSISKPPSTDLDLRDVATAEVPPPPPPPEEEPPEQEPEPEPPPQLAEESQPLDLAQMELALNPGGGEGWFGGDVLSKLDAGGGLGGDFDELFSMSELDQQPRVIYQPGPVMDARLRRAAPGTVYVIFIVDRNGRVENPKVQRSTSDVFDQAALNAVKQWKFEPGQRGGQPVRFRMRVPITFPKG